MRKSTFLLIFSCLSLLPAFGQKPVALRALALLKEKNVDSFSLFDPAIPSKSEYGQYISESNTMSIKPEVLNAILTQRPGLLRLDLPQPLNISLDLYQAEVFSQSAEITTSDGSSFTPDPQHLFYRGMVHGNVRSLAVVSIFENRVQILWSDDSGNKRIQKTKEGNYITFEDSDILIPKQLECYTSDDHLNPASEDRPSDNRTMTGNCVEVYVECDYDSYLENGSSVANTEEWVAELWNEVITLYDNEDIPVAVSDVFVYTSTDPFAGLNNTGAVLDAFVEHMNDITYDGRLAHLLSTRSLGGGIAYVDVLCSTSFMCAVSASLSTTIVPVPTYSWNVEVVTHEMGHNMGSSHTHKCVWNGNNTQIDDCGNQYAANTGQNIEGAACYNPNAPIIPASGTIMSYCHLISGVGINFNNGFGTQPGNLIRSKFNNASCNTGTCSTPLCTNLTIPAPNSTNADINIDLTWASSPGANGYRLTVATTPNGNDIINNLDVGLVTTYNLPNPLPFNTTIYVRIIPYNELGDASCSYQSFSTEPNILPLCTSLASPLAGATNVSLSANIQWAHSVGNQTGYKITIGTTPTGGEIANQLNVGNVTSYDPPGYLPHSSVIYVKITPYGANGDVPGCVTQSFTTLIPINGDFCNLAIDLPCGASISGNTTLAYPDPEAPTCEVSIQAPGIWFKFTGDGQNTIITTCSQYGYDTQLNAYTGSCSGFTCVAGNDDFCQTGSRITFPTVNGTTYYILVQGWGGEVGSFTVSRSCYGGLFYCQSGGRTANQEWISNFSFAGFVKASGSSHYTDNTSETISISRGGSYSISVTPQFPQSSRNELFRAWIDFNKDGDFADSGEQVLNAGPSSSMVNGTVSIPLTASTGLTRMRVSMKRPSGAPGPCDLFSYGEVEDYTVNIRCNLVTTTLDSGAGSLRNVSMCADDNESILFAPALNNQTILVTGTSLNADGMWKWMPGTNTNISIRAEGINRVLSIPAGRKVEMQNLVLIGGTAPNGSAIDVDGTLILRNTDLQRPPGSTSRTLRNEGIVTIQGSCDIR